MEEKIEELKNHLQFLLDRGPNANLWTFDINFIIKLVNKLEEEANEDSDFHRRCE